MTEELKEDSSSIIEHATDTATDLLSGSTIPAPIKKNFFKAVSQLCTAAVDIPVSYLEGKASENRAETSARLKLIETNASQIANKMNVNPEYAKAAVEKFGQRIIKEQINLDDIVQKATEEVNKASETVKSEDTLEKEIKDDWLSAFEKEASQKSSEDMRTLFGKILAGEIQNPSSFSIRTIRLLGQLDNEAANLFLTFCSLCVSLRHNNEIIDARVVSLSGQAGQNSLKKYGLSFTSLNVLEEYGLIVSEYNTNSNYGGAFIRSGQVALPMYFQDRMHYFKYQGVLAPQQSVNLSGVMLSKAGKELFKLVDVVPNQEYFDDLIAYFNTQQIELVCIAM
jgi:hypothetical protein